MLESDIQIKTHQYDGPLSLLLLLIQKEEMDIRNLNISVITQQYLDYLQRMKDLNFDLAGDYLYMAATLLYLKSEHCFDDGARERMQQILEGEDNPLGITSKDELIKRLTELKRYQALGETLWKMEKVGHEVFLKPRINRKDLLNSLVSPTDINSLMMGMMEIMVRQGRQFTVMKRDKLSIKEKLSFLKEYLQEGESTTFFELLEEGNHNQKGILENKVITFISLLELARLKKIEIYQNEDLNNIYIKIISSLKDFDVDMATGFEMEEDGPGEVPEVPETEMLTSSLMMDEGEKILQ